MKVSQDLKQRLGVVLTVTLELYRVITGSLLVLFIPQICEEPKAHMCTISENLIWNQTIGPVYGASLVLNFVTLFQFLVLYVCEIIRENRLIKYLDVNVKKPCDESHMETICAMIPGEKMDKIHSIDLWYKRFGYSSIFIYCVNIILSIIIVEYYYAGNQSVTSLLVYILFMCTKLSSVFTIANTEKNIFYSAYLKSNVQYNDIDKTIAPDAEIKVEIDDTWNTN